MSETKRQQETRIAIAVAARAGDSSMGLTELFTVVCRIEESIDRQTTALVKLEERFKELNADVDDILRHLTVV
ncbi:MAG: hypothetical protein ACW98W_19945 [Candidatus Hodarchaeales archaeon]|jgi:cell division protein FtsB